MPNQTVYNEDRVRGFPGQVVDTGLAVIVSRTVEAGSADMGFGVAAVRGATERTTRVSAAGDTAANIEGISVRLQGINAETPNAIASPYEASVMLQGAIWVTVTEAVEFGDKVHYDVAAQTFSKTGGVTLANATYESDAAANGVAVVRLN